MDKYAIDLEPNRERDILDREERCQKTMRAVTKAVVMRLVICILLIWIVFQSAMEIWLIGLMLLVMIINLTGMLPLFAELKKRRQEWRRLLEEEE